MKKMKKWIAMGMALVLSAMTAMPVAYAAGEQITYRWQAGGQSGTFTVPANASAQQITAALQQSMGPTWAVGGSAQALTQAMSQAMATAAGTGAAATATAAGATATASAAGAISTATLAYGAGAVVLVAAAAGGGSSNPTAPGGGGTGGTTGTH